MDIQETLILDFETYKQVQTLAKNEKKTFQDETAYLLEKGIWLAETIEMQSQTRCIQDNA